jgi:hypothetical protein
MKQEWEHVQKLKTFRQISFYIRNVCEVNGGQTIYNKAQGHIKYKKYFVFKKCFLKNSTFKKFHKVEGSVIMSTVVFIKNYIKNKSTGMLHATGTAI